MLSRKSAASNQNISTDELYIFQGASLKKQPHVEEVNGLSEKFAQPPRRSRKSWRQICKKNRRESRDVALERRDRRQATGTYRLNRRHTMGPHQRSALVKPWGLSRVRVGHMAKNVVPDPGAFPAPFPGRALGPNGPVGTRAPRKYASPYASPSLNSLPP